MLEKPFKNHRKKWAVFERFYKQDLSGLSGFFKKKTPKPPKMLKTLKFCWKTAQTAHILSGFWVVFLVRFERFERFFQKKLPNRSNLAEKPLKPLISWAGSRPGYFYTGGAVLEVQIQNEEGKKKLADWSYL